MSQDELLGLLVSAWILTIMPAFLFATFTKYTSPRQPAALRMMKFWAAGFVVLMALYGLGLGFTAAAIWTAVFVVGSAAWVFGRVKRS